MGLNRELGEYIEALGSRYVVGDIRAWQGSPFFEDAVQHAVKVFRRAGALQVRLSFDDMLVQTYPDHRKAVFLFAHKIAGKEYFADYTFDFSEAAVGELESIGVWPELPPDLAHVQ